MKAYAISGARKRMVFHEHTCACIEIRYREIDIAICFDKIVFYQRFIRLV